MAPVITAGRLGAGFALGVRGLGGADLAMVLVDQASFAGKVKVGFEARGSSLFRPVRTVPPVNPGGRARRMKKI
jgi:hypothetical protein